MTSTTRTFTTVLALGAFAVSGVAQAAPAKPSVSAGSGALKGSAVAFTVNNKSAYKVKGKVALSAGKLAAGKRAYSAKPKGKAKVSVPLSAAAKAALAKKGSLKLTVKTSAKGGGKSVVRTSSVTVRKAAAKAPAKPPVAKPDTRPAPSSTGSQPNPAPAAGGAPSQGNPGGGIPGGGDPQPEPQPTPVDWRAGHLVDNSYNAFTFRTDAGKLTLTSVPSFNVKCTSAGSSQAEVTAAESFKVPGPFTVGDQGVATTQTTTLDNSLMASKPGTVSYTMSTTAQDDDHITGEMKIYAYRWESSGTPGKPGYWYRSITCGGAFPFQAIKN